MKRIFFACGPSQLYPTVPKHLKDAIGEDVPSISHRGAKFQEIYRSAQEGLSKLLSIPKTQHIFFLSSSLESMERILENCVEKNSFHFVNGAFSKKFYQMAVDLKRKPEKVEVVEGYGFDFESLRHSGQTRMTNKVELIAITHNETSTGVSIPIQSIKRLDLLFPRALIAIDVVSSAPFVKLDFKLADIVFFSVQKEFGLPAGMGILIVNDKAIKKADSLKKRGKNIGSYHSFPSLLKKNEIFQTPETPNVLGIYLLDNVIKDMLQRGIKTIREETEKKAKLLYDFFDNHPRYQPFVKEKEFRSQTTIVIDVKGEAKKIIEKLKTKGMIVSSGYGKFKETHIRIANFPVHTIPEVKSLLNYIYEVAK